MRDRWGVAAHRTNKFFFALPNFITIPVDGYGETLIYDSFTNHQPDIVIEMQLSGHARKR